MKRVDKALCGQIKVEQKDLAENKFKYQDDTGVFKCPICGAPGLVLGEKRGRFSQRVFMLCHCALCSYFFVANPLAADEKLYCREYYVGKGADPLYNPVMEMDLGDVSIRQYEYRAIVALLTSLQPMVSQTSWLDYGCGLGGLVRYAQKNTPCSVWGYDSEPVSTMAKEYGISLLGEADLNKRLGTFDIITAIDVLEHVSQPREFVRRVRSLLKKGGIFFFGTANVQPFKKNVLRWGYFIPEIHVSLYTPQAVQRLCALEGMSYCELSQFQKQLYCGIYRYKILKNLGIQRSNGLWELLTPPLLMKAVNAYFRLSNYGVGVAA